MTNLFNTLMQYRATFWIDIPRQIFVWIDSAIYWLISSVYGLIEDLARIQIFRESTLNNFYNKIYLLLSIFMLFKVSFSIVSYILDPAKTVDKNSGFGKIITNVVIMFVMILSAPIAFKYLTKLQNAILDDDIILNFVFGDVGSTNVNNEIQLADSERCQEWSKIHDGMRKYNPASPGMSIANNNGDYLAVTIYRVFFTLADTKVETGKGPDDHKNGGKTLDVKKGKYVFDFMCNDNNTHISVSDMASFVNAYVDEINDAGSNGYYLIEYKFFVATAVGVFALLMLINIAFETSVRAIKLGFYQLIAPIPIISYIDPNSSKNGVFSKYIKALGKTWISLFIRLFSLYFAIFVIKEFNTNFVQDLGELHSSKFFITLFVIIGALMFAKQLPQLIEELFPGMKMGKMQLNPFKNIAENAVGGKLVTGAAVGAAAMGARGLSQAGSNLYAFGRNRHNLKKGIAEAEAKSDYDKAEKLKRQLKRNNFGRAVGTTFGGLAGGATRGLKSGYNTGKSGSGNIFKGTKQDLQSGNTKRNNRAAINDYNAELKSQLKDGKISKEDYENGKYDFWNRNVTEKLDKVSGVKNSYGGYGYYNNKVSELQRKIDNNNEIEHSMRDAVASYSSNHGISTLDLYDFHKNNSNKSNIELEQSILDKYTKDSSGNVIRGITSDGKIAFKDTDEDRKLQAEYEKERKLLDGYKEQRSQLEAINKVDEETKEMKKEQKQYKEMADSMPNDVKEK